MPNIRQQNDFTEVQDEFFADLSQLGRDPGDEPFMPPDYPDIGAITQVAEMEGPGPNGAQVAEQIVRQFHGELLTFESKMARLLHLMGRRMNEEREARGFSLHFNRAERRGKGGDGLDITYADADGVKWKKGDIIGGEDADNRRCGRTLSLIPEAEKAAVSLIDEYAFDADKLPIELWALGSNGENHDKERMLEMAFIDQHARTGYKAQMRKVMWDFVRHDYAAARNKWKVRTKLVTNEETGELEEQIVHEGIDLKHWPPQNVWFSDYDKPTAEQQESILYYSEVTLSQLQEDEAFLIEPEQVRLKQDGSLGISRLVAEKGRFRGLDRLRRRYQAWSGQEQQRAIQATDFNWIDSRPGTQSQRERARRKMQALLGLVELEGHLPISSMVYTGDVTPAVLDYWGIDIGDYSQMTRREVAQRLERVFWCVAMTTDRHLIELRPTPYTGANGEPRHTIAFGSYYPGDGVIGQGITRACWDANEMADFYLNEIVYNAVHMSRGKVAINSKRTLGADSKEISFDKLVEWWRTPEGVLQYDGTNVNIKDAIQQFVPPSVIEELFPQLLFQKERVEAISSMTEQVKGQASAKNTATADQNAQESSLRLGRHSGKVFGERFVEEVAKATLACFAGFMEATGDMHRPGSWEEYILQVAGAMGLNSWYLIPDLKDIPRQIMVVHSGSPVGRKDLMIAFLGQMLEQDVHGALDPREIRKEQLSLMDQRDGDRFILGSTEPREPDEEVRAFANDHYLKPVDGENLVDHLMVHTMQLLAIDPGYLVDLGGESIFMLVAQAVGPIPAERFFMEAREWAEISGTVAPPGLENYAYDSQVLAPTLLKHAIETRNRLEQLAQEMAMQAALQQAEGGGNGPPGEGEDPNQGGGTSERNKGLAPDVTDQGDLGGMVQNSGQPESAVPAGTGA